MLAFSLFAFIITYNRRSSIGRSFSALLACVCFAYVGDVAIFQVNSLENAIPWLKFQWVGIAFIPAAYLHFSDALLRTTNDFSKFRRIAIFSCYICGAIFLYFVVFTDLLVHDGFFLPGIAQFRAGSLFGLFMVYFFAAVIWGFSNIQRARDRCLTSATRRRMKYLTIAFAAPSFGVFPYMLVAHQSSEVSPLILLIVLFIVNIAIDIMIVVMGYSVAFFDAFTPDRIVKYTLANYLLRGPLVAMLVIMVIIAMPNRNRLLGLPRDAILITSIVSIIVLAQLIAPYLKPIVNRIIYRQDIAEVELLRYVDTRLLTTTDLHQALENVLTAICDILRVRTGFIANIIDHADPRLEISVGDSGLIEKALSNFNASLFNVNSNQEKQNLFVEHDNFWFVPLQTKNRDHYLGLLGIESGHAPLPENENNIFKVLVEQAEFVLEDRFVQGHIFRVMQQIIPEMERSQRVRSAVRYLGSPIEPILPETKTGNEQADGLIHQSNFPQMVHNALTHYWGGPKLTNSPLLNLKIVQNEADENHNGDVVKGLRTVLGQAIEDTRPNGERRMTASEWLFYNILELKFIQGWKVRDIAHRLARSEADLYRKQKIAVNAVAESLRNMENQKELSNV
ncbi:MAG: hypothetical protein B6242_10300 [Anaerolineaceae bacterium 4572_78]|nr:MAG: hypothetical protein B6242_10300 [Anaerolineaceae bacterium 4572_78]